MRKTFTLVAAVLATSAFAAVDTLPSSATVETWYFNGNSVWPAEQLINKEVQVAIDGDDIYFTGLYSSISTWAKGTKNGDVYEFATGQDMGMLWGAYNMSFAGYDGSNPVLATAQLADGVLTFNTGIGYLYTDYPDSSPEIWYEAGATMSVEPVEYVEPVLNENTAAVPYKNNFDSESKRNQVALHPDDETGWAWGANWDTGNWFATCNNDGWNQADDYMILPGLTLEAGKNYVLNFDAQSSSSSYWQYYEVLMAPEAKLSKFTEKLIPSGMCYSNEWQNVEQEFTVAEAGTYYIAIHCTSYAYNGFFNIDNFSVEEVDMDKPAVAQNVNVTPGRNGALEATVNFTMPSANIGGVAYGSDKMLSYKVTRGEFIIGEGSAKACDMVFVSDNGMGLTNGFATYKVVIADDSHVSKEATASAYIGIDYPTETEYIEISAEGNMVTIAWVPVTKGANGGYVGAKYNVYKCPAKYQQYAGEKLNAEPLTECFYTFEMDVESGEQGEAWFCVTAVNDIDESYGAYQSLAVGAPYDLPFADSFTDESHVWNYGGEGAGVYADRWGSFSSDGDDASLCFYIWNWDTEASYAEATTGKICTAANAELSFDYKAECDTKFAIQLFTNGEDDMVEVANVEFAAGSESTFTLPAVFAGVADRSFVKVVFTARMNETYRYFFMDNLKIQVNDTPDGIIEVRGELSDKLYSIDGKTLNSRPAAGLYIQNGQKVMIK